MKPYSHGLRTRVFSYSLTLPVLKKTRTLPVSLILSFAVLAFPALTDASPEELAKIKNCSSCHKVETKRIGPSYIDIARKYNQDKDARIKIIKQTHQGSAQQSDKTSPSANCRDSVGLPDSWPMVQHHHAPQPQVNADEANSWGIGYYP
ncbi:MAG: hypothetical protein PHG00_02015 [Methylococcales bacterium]|nr:hypothetical protein [Methylococcales bacterium]